MITARYSSPDLGWIRLGRWLLVWTCCRPYFSERYGYVKYNRIPWTKWRWRLERE